MKKEEIIEELEAIYEYMDSKDAVYGFGQIKDLIEKLKSELLGQEDKISKRPKIICICGSGRFLKEMHEAEERMTLNGIIVFSIGVNTKDVARIKELKHYKPMLDKLHLRKIDLADEVFVINKDGYIGESTRNEINYARKLGKPIKYMESVQDKVTGRDLNEIDKAEEERDAPFDEECFNPDQKNDLNT